MKSLKTSLIKIFTRNNIQHTPYYLIALLTLNMLIVTGVTIGLLYNIGYNRQKSQLVDLVETQSIMIDLVVRQVLIDCNTSPSEAAKKTIAAKFIRQITETYPRYGTIGKSGEFTLGQRNGNMIGFILKQRYFDEKGQMSIPWKSTFAEPMRRALKGQKGADVMLDYRGATVLAAYKPIPYLEWGLVAKIDLDEIRAPYIHAASYALLFTLVLAIGSSIVFWFFVNPLITEIEDARQFNNLLISKSSTGLVLCTFEGEFIDANESFLKIVGCTLNQLIGSNYLNIVASKYVEYTKSRLKTLRETGTLEPSESCYIRSQGDEIPVRISGELIKMKSSLYLWLSVDDIREYKQREAELMLSAAVFENSQEAIFITDNQKNIIKANQAFSTVTGFSLDEILGKTPSFLKSGRHDASFYEKIFQSIHRTGSWHGEIWNKRKDGTIYPSLQSITAIYDDNQKLIRYVAILTDISIQKAYEQQLYDRAHTDALTELPNRLHFEQKFDQMLLRVQHAQQKFALFFIDLNRFKEINDTLGHDVGDALLKSVAASLKEGVRSEDFVARLGGDEFVVIIVSISHNEEAVQIAQHLMERAQQMLTIREHTVQPSLSIGIAIYPDHGTDRSTLLKCVDQAMYHAKHNTDDHYHIFSATIYET